MGGEGRVGEEGGGGGGGEEEVGGWGREVVRTLTALLRSETWDATSVWTLGGGWGRSFDNDDKVGELYAADDIMCCYRGKCPPPTPVTQPHPHPHTGIHIHTSTHTDIHIHPLTSTHPHPQINIHINNHPTRHLPPSPTLLSQTLSYSPLSDSQCRCIR